MTDTLVWDDAGARYFETGVFKGTLFPMDGPGVPWNGLVSVNIDPSGGEPESYYFDGTKYMDQVLAEDFQATIAALNTPKEFEPCEGIVEFQPGVKTPFNKRSKFNLAWRTRIGNDENENLAYKLHIAYNCLVQPAARSYQTIADTTTLDTRSFVITATPACGKHSYFWFDSREYDLTELETQLDQGVMPHCWELGGLITPVGPAPPPTDDSCLSVLETFEEYNPGQPLDVDKVEQANLVETVIYGKVNNGFDLTTLPAVGSFAANDSAASEVGTGDILADDDDATYITSADGDLGYTVGIPPLVGYVDGCQLQLHIRASISGGVNEDDPDNVDADMQVHISTDSTGDTRVGGFSDGTDEGMGFALQNVDGVPVDYVIPLDISSWIDTSMDSVVSTLADGAFLNVVGATNNNPDSTLPAPEVRTYEMSVVMIDATETNKCLRTRTPTDSAHIEHQIYDAPGGSDVVQSNTVEIDFKVKEAQYDADVEGFTQEPTRWLITGTDNDPGTFQIEPNDVDSGIRMDPTAVDNFNTSTPVTFGDVWNDNSDSTYANFGDSDATSNGAHGFLPAYTGGKIVGLKLRFRASATGDTNQPMFVELDTAAPSYGAMMRFYGGASTGASSSDTSFGPGASWDIPNDGVIRDYVVQVNAHMLDDAGWDDIDEIREMLAGGGCSLYFWAEAYNTDPLTYPTGEIRIYDAHLEVIDENTHTGPLLKWLDDTSTSTGYEMPIDTNVWYRLIADWTWDDCRARILDRETSVVLFDHTRTL